MRLIRRDPNKGYLGESLWLPRSLVNVDGLKNALTFNLFDSRTPSVLQLWRETRDHIVVPRAFYKVEELEVPIVDYRPWKFPSISIKSHIKLDHRKGPNGTIVPTGETTQRDALDALLRAQGGVLQLSCGKGKTIIGLELIVRLGVPGLVIIPDTQLMEQWRKEIKLFLDLKDEDIGLIQAESFDWKKPIVLATYATMANRALTMPEEVRRWFGVVLWEEGHHVPAPTFSKTVDLFYGRRYGLSATPDRTDGRHVIAEFNIGPVVYKNLHQDLKPEIAFMWTGLEIDEKDPKVGPLVCDVRGELHYSKLAGYFGQWRARLDFILNEVQNLHQQGRKILVLSNSVAEVVNLLALWNGAPQLYTDIPVPTAAEVGETVAPARLEDRDIRRYRHTLGVIYGHLRDPQLNPVKRKNYEDSKKNLEFRLQQHVCWEKVSAELTRRQRQYIKAMVAANDSSKAGLMIYKVHPSVRTKMLEEKEITFAITKYGREGLDNPALDTLLVCEPITDRGGLEQRLGRIQRVHVGKHAPLAIFIEDNIGLMIGMCNKLRSHLRSWPVEQGGPLEFSRIGHPSNRRKDPPWMTRSLPAFGQ